MKQLMMYCMIGSIIAKSGYPRIEKNETAYLENISMKTFAQSFIVALFILVMSVPVKAKGLNGNDLLRKCQGQDGTTIMAMNKGFCLGLIAGYTDSLRTSKNLNLCIPNEVEWGQRMEVVVKYLENHSEKRHIYYEVLIIEALKEAFPCKKTEPNAK